ncbi:glycosyltransferase family 4 protein [Sunxiuqinia sp. sy24]|uniref:glycosyltransferase family 4 protein n=1 Tax=Sunxiuqinia sp. sy24 TaxID=3461495 RepID=UPI004045F992
MKTNVLFLLHLPPAIHGSAIVGLSIKESRLINQTFDARYINLLLSSEVNESGDLTIRKLHKGLRIAVKLIRELFRKRPSVCYFALTTTGAAFLKDFILILLLKMFGVRRVYHLHNKGFEEKKDSFFFRRLFHFAFANSIVILLSSHLYSDVAPYVAQQQIRLCPNGVAMAGSSMQEMKNEVPEILFLSNLIKSKGVEVLLDACVLLKTRNCSFHCTIAGGDGDISGKQLVEMIRQKELVDQVAYVGGKFGLEKELVFRSSDIFAFPTYYKSETFGLVNVEAMQYQLPVVSTFEGGIPDVVDNGVTGFLVPQQDVSALTDKLELLIKDERLRKQMGEAGHRRYLKEFTLEKFEHRLVDILQREVDGSSMALS